MPTSPDSKSVIDALIKKNCIKQEVYNNTLSVFNLFKKETENFVKHNLKRTSKCSYPLVFEYNERSIFEFQLKFGSDILIFFMHSNVFEIPRDHMLMKTSYIRDEKSRSYCGIIHIFNFLSDSFKYNRTSDIGYCIGRIFINRERHYFTEGKREIGLIYTNFANSILNEEAIRQILYSSIQYTLNFDLLTPPYDKVKEVTVAEMQTTLDNMSISTGKRLGFRFQEDPE